MSDLAIVIVSYNTCELLHRCIETIHASLADAHIAYTIVVADNASSDGTPEMLCTRHPDVVLLEPRSNIGFAAANNLALRWLLERYLPAAILLLNPDTEVIGGAIPQMFRYLKTHPDVAVVGPQLRYPDGSAQPSRRRFPTPGTLFWESTPLEVVWPNNPWAKRYRYADQAGDTEQEVDWLVGAALMVRTSAIEQAGILDPGFHMYSEELEWQQRIRRVLSASRRIVYLPNAVVLHHEGKSSEQVLVRRYLDFQHSRLRYTRMFYGRWLEAILRVFLVLIYAAELAQELAKWLIGHKRRLRAQRACIYWQVVRKLSTGLRD